MTLDQIKNYAEYQAQDVHFPQNRYLLENALWSEGHEASYKVYVCFVQSVASSDEVRAFVYDENSNNLNQLMAEAINSNQELMAELLENCIKLECESDEETVILEGNDVEVAKSEISEDIKEAEKHLVKEEEESTQIPIETSPDNKAVETDHKSLEKDRLHKKALYDSLSFEIELQKIFNEDDPDEIWLISPWIRKSAFIHDRGPLIENFLKDDSKRVFIAYSEPASNNDGKPMMDEEVEPGIKLLAEQYPNFFYVQLPEFHLKNVIEVKGDQKILFSGSFNVLSFSVSEQQKHVRREEMTLAHHTVAKNKYADFQLEFAQIYAERIKKEIEVLDSLSISNYKNERLEYFSGIDNQEIQKIFSPIEDLLAEKNLSVVKSKIMKKLTTIGQQLVAASNMGGLNAKDKKKIGTELSEVKKIISENSIDDPSSLDQLSTTKELYEKIPLKQIFPNKSRKADNRTPKTINKPLANEGATNPNLDEKVKNLISGDNPSDEKEMLYLLLSLSYASSRRLITKGDLQKNIKHIVMDLADLYTILTVESSMNNDQATDITIGVSHHSVKFRNLYLGNTRIQYERHVKTLNDGKRLTWVTPRNVESILSNLLK